MSRAALLTQRSRQSPCMDFREVLLFLLNIHLFIQRFTAVALWVLRPQSVVCVEIRTRILKLICCNGVALKGCYGVYGIAVPLATQSFSYWLPLLNTMKDGVKIRLRNIVAVLILKYNFCAYEIILRFKQHVGIYYVN